MPRWIFSLLFVVSTTLQAQVFEGKTLVTPSLVADTQQIVPGQPFQVGLLLQAQPHWHTYWEYPGDAGVPTSIKWALSEGFAAGPIQWPLPERLKEPGDIEVYAFGEKTLLITTIVPPKDFAGQSATIKASASWLVCAEICVPGNADLEITLPVATAAQPANEALFQEFQKQWPSADAPPYQLNWKQTGDKWELSVSGLGDAKEIDLFPLPSAEQQVQHASGGEVVDGKATVTIEAPGELKGVLVVDGPSGRKGWFVSSAGVAAASPKAGTPVVAGTTLWQALFYGFLGGLILNLMPCVLPVISLKIFGFIKQAGERRERIFRHGLAFVAGIFTWFMGLALVIVGLKLAGHEVTWAFQFQNPWFNLIIASIVFVFALNLFGVFEVILPGKANNALAEASSGEGYLGSYSQGLFATLLATPCTAPFLGAALGFAFSQSSFVILALFAAVSLGMSAPYFLLSAQPGWMKILPKPGAWMERVKQFMAFPLLATLIWLLAVLGGQKGLDGVIWASAFLLCLGLACWIYGSFAGPFASTRAKLISFVLIVLVVGGGGWMFLGNNFAQSRPASGGSKATAEGGIAWEDFSAKELAALRAQGKPVFVDFTADWCISCKFNERTAINVPAVQAAFKERNIVAMKADWTNANPEITAALKEFGRVGVPFYVLYPANNGEPIILPELLTQQIVLDALAKAN